MKEKRDKIITIHELALGYGDSEKNGFKLV